MIDPSHPILAPAMDIAREAHAGQTYGREPEELKDYFDYHVMGVAETLNDRWGDFFPDLPGWWSFSDNRMLVFAAMILHDSIEDSPDPDRVREQIREAFPEVVSQFVEGMTKPKGAEYAEYIIDMRGRSPLKTVVRALKQADLTFNIRHSKRGAALSKYLLSLHLLSPQNNV